MPTITTTYLEMTSPAGLRPKACDDPRFRILEATVKQWRLNRFLYELVGRDWSWTDKLVWSQKQWREYAEDDRLRTFVAYWDGSPAGYFELAAGSNHTNGDTPAEQDRQGEVEIAYLGLAPPFIGRGFGGALLTRALEEAWKMQPKRVWLHTCSRDHPAALKNYLARGMVVYHTETTAVGPAAASREGS